MSKRLASRSNTKWHVRSLSAWRAGRSSRARVPSALERRVGAITGARQETRARHTGVKCQLLTSMSSDGQWERAHRRGFRGSPNRWHVHVGWLRKRLQRFFRGHLPKRFHYDLGRHSVAARHISGLRWRDLRRGSGCQRPAFVPDHTRGEWLNGLQPLRRRVRGKRGLALVQAWANDTHGVRRSSRFPRCRRTKMAS